MPPADATVYAKIGEDQAQYTPLSDGTFLIALGPASTEQKTVTLTLYSRFFSTFDCSFYATLFAAQSIVEKAPLNGEELASLPNITEGSNVIPQIVNFSTEPVSFSLKIRTDSALKEEHVFDSGKSISFAVQVLPNVVKTDEGIKLSLDGNNPLSSYKLIFDLQYKNESDNVYYPTGRNVFASPMVTNNIVTDSITIEDAGSYRLVVMVTTELEYILQEAVYYFIIQEAT